MSAAIFATGLAVAGAGCHRAPATTAEETVHRIGRFDTRDPHGPRFAWPASALETTFTGTGLDVRLRDTGTNFFAVIVDGKALPALATDPQRESYTLASGLPDGRHTVRVTKRTESNVGVVQFLGFVPHGGALVPTSPRAGRRIEFVGDSVTCGYGVLGTDPAVHFRPELEDETTAYAALTADALDASHVAVAYSGIGAFRSFAGETHDQMPARFTRALADDPTSAWTFPGPAPDVVVVNLGANDFAKGDPGGAFEKAYAELVRAIRRAYPRSMIVCALGSTLSDAGPIDGMHRTKAANAIRDVVDDLTRESDARLRYFAFEEQRPGDGFGSDYHPSAATQRKMAEGLTAFLRTLMGW